MALPGLRARRARGPSLRTGHGRRQGRRHGPRRRRWLLSPRREELNIKFIIEGEEEIGSRNLDRFLEQYRTKMAADFIVLTDTRNYDVGHPALTYQLRGICKVSRPAASDVRSRP